MLHVRKETYIHFPLKGFCEGGLVIEAGSGLTNEVAQWNAVKKKWWWLDTTVNVRMEVETFY